MEDFQKERIVYFTFYVNSLLPKIDETRFIAKKSNVFITGTSESKLDSFILNS